MTFSDIPFRPSQKVLRQFSAAWLVLFLGLALWRWLGAGQPQVAVWMLAAALIIGVPGLVYPASVRWLFVGWMVLVFPIGWLVSLVILSVVYFLVITPIALLLRWSGRDVLGRQLKSTTPSYWQPKSMPVSVASYFRQH